MIIASKPATPESRKNHADTFGTEGLTRGRWLEEGRPDETFSEWRERMIYDVEPVNVFEALQRACVYDGDNACNHESDEYRIKFMTRELVEESK